jgi:hypothetical protein
MSQSIHLPLHQTVRSVALFHQGVKGRKVRATQGIMLPNGKGSQVQT